MASFKKLDIFYSKLKSNTILVYLYLERHGARKRQCFHSTRTIADNLNISQRSVNRAMNELEVNGYILRINRYRQNGGKSSNLYEILK